MKMDKIIYYRERAIRKTVKNTQLTTIKNFQPVKHYFRGTRQKRTDVIPKCRVTVMSPPAQRDTQMTMP